MSPKANRYKKVIPCLDVKDGRVVKGVNFVELRDAGDPVEMAQVYSQEGADEIVFLDIAATQEERDTTVELASQVAEAVQTPFAVGGGFRTVEDIAKMLMAGAHKCSVNSAAVKTPEILTRAAKTFGQQAVICAIDAKRVPGAGDKWTVVTSGGKVDEGIDPIQWAQEVERRGAGEILLTSMDGDGAKEGYDLALTRAVSRAVDIPVTASGGVGTLEHFAMGILEGEADAVLAASVFHFGELSIREVKEYLAAQNIPVAM